jgi:hypothetical protein
MIRADIFVMIAILSSAATRIATIAILYFNCAFGFEVASTLEFVVLIKAYSLVLCGSYVHKYFQSTNLR